MPDVEIVFPSREELERGWEAQQAEELARRFRAGVRPMTEAEAELRADGILDPPPPPTPSCAVCGKRFSYAKAGMAKMQMSRHMRREHPAGA